MNMLKKYEEQRNILTRPFFCEKKKNMILFFYKKAFN